MSRGDGKPDFSDVSKTVRSLLGRDVQETKAARQSAPAVQGSISVAHGPIFFCGQMDNTDVKELMSAAIMATQRKDSQ